MSRYLNPRSDLVFKKIFGEQSFSPDVSLVTVYYIADRFVSS